MAQPTLKYLKSRIEEVVEANEWFHSCVVGEQYNFDELVPAWPTLWVVPNQYAPSPQGGMTEVSFFITALDLVDDELSSEVDVLSACATGIEDVYNALVGATKQGGSYSGELWRVTKLEGRQKIVDNVSDHMASGWMCEIYFEIPFNKGTCNIP